MHLHTHAPVRTPAAPSCAPRGLVKRRTYARPEQGTAIPTACEGVDYGRLAQASVVTAVVLGLVAGPAHAEERAWKPRRHYRRMGERISDTWAQEAVEAEERYKEEQLARSQWSKRQQIQREEEAFQRMKQEQEQRMQRAEKLMSVAEPSGRRLPFSVKVGGVELVPYMFWGTLAALVLWASRSMFQNAQRRRQQGGRWVYDRSLGGKKVWVPDVAGSADAASTSTSFSRPDEFDRLVSLAAAARAKAGSSGSKEFRLPGWWNLAPTSFASPDMRAAKQSEADRLLTRIEQAKNRGEDYSIADILQLRALCQEGGVSVRPKTVGARDAIYAAAVETAVSYAQDRTKPEHDIGDVGSENPETRLVTALAGDLGMPEERAVSMVRGAVASACRARLLDALRFLKASNEMDALVALMRLSSLVEHMPVLDSSVEPELIASSLQATSTVEERQKIFYILGQLHVEGAPLYAEMLGFDPSLVVPKLYADVDAYRQQQAPA